MIKLKVEFELDLEKYPYRCPLQAWDSLGDDMCVYGQGDCGYCDGDESYPTPKDCGILQRLIKDSCYD